MPILHVRNVSDPLYERIRQQAQEQNRSIRAEVIRLLNKALAQADLSQAELLANIRRRRSFRLLEQGAPDSTTLLRQDRLLSQWRGLTPYLGPWYRRGKSGCLDSRSPGA
jgi:plasmid stability protein